MRYIETQAYDPASAGIVIQRLPVDPPATGPQVVVQGYDPAAAGIVEERVALGDGGGL